MKNIGTRRDSGSISIEIIRDFEMRIDYYFPEIYTSLLSKHNAFHPEKTLFDFDIAGKKGTRDITFFGFGYHLKDFERIDQFQDHDTYGHDGLVAIGGSANGDYICFNYRSDPKTDNPPVVVMFHDNYDADNKMLVYPVANTFDDFLGLLYEEEKTELTKENHQRWDKIIQEAEIRQEKLNKYLCPCCEKHALTDPRTYEECSTCGWVDDVDQFNDPALEIGANEISLNKARFNYLRYGSIE